MRVELRAEAIEDPREEGAGGDGVDDIGDVGVGQSRLTQVIDVAAGAGGQTLAAARRTGPTGVVLATDIAPAILTLAQANADRAGLTNIAIREMDGEDLEVQQGQYGAVISRLGLIYFPDQHRALTGLRRALRPGGRLAAVVYSTPDRNAFFSVPVSVIRERAHLPAPAPGQPGPFSLGTPGVAARALEDAGFTEVIEVRLDAPLLMDRAAECVRFERESFGALHQMLSTLGRDEQDAAWTEITRRLEAYDGPTGFRGPCELVVVVGTAPPDIS